MSAQPRLFIWRVERAWARGSVRWLAWTALMLCAAVGASALAWSWQSATKERTAVTQQLQQITSAPTASVAAGSTGDADFVQALGPLVPTATVVQDLQRASSEAGIVLASVQAQSREASNEQLGRLELAVTLRGPYTGAKQVLKQVVERYPNLTVQRLRMRRAQSAADVETSVTLLIWSAPLPVSGAGDVRNVTAVR